MMTEAANIQSTSPTYSGKVSQDNAAKNASETAAAKKTSHWAVAKHQMNASILEASAKVSLAAGQQSQALLFRSAIDRINQILAPEVGSNTAIQNAAAGQNNSPEATADRIVQLSTAMLGSYMKQHPNEDPEAAAQKFVDIIRKGFEKGYNEAKGILEGMKVFQGDVKSGVEKTFELVQKGYDDFLTKTIASFKPAAETPAETTTD